MKYLIKSLILIVFVVFVACSGAPSEDMVNSGTNGSTETDGSGNGTDGSTEDCNNVTISTQFEASHHIQSLDTEPLPQEVENAIDAGCSASQNDKIKFLEAFLCSLGINPSLAENMTIQEDVDNLEGLDLEDLSFTCM